MHPQLVYLWSTLSSSLWLAPGLMMLGAIVLSMLTVLLDAAVELPWPLQVGPDGSRALLSAIAGSMITVASLVFSITLLVLQLASSQLGPRVITRFMRDRLSQVVLGTFTATFLYALLVLRTLSGDATHTPAVSVTLALVLVVISLVLLIAFIHHIAVSIQADSAIADVGGELEASLAWRFPLIENPAQVTLRTGRVLLDRFATDAVPLSMARSGYIQAVDITALVELARERDLVLELDRRPGHFVVAGAEIGRVWPQERFDSEVEKAARGAILLGRKRTLSEDIEFPISLLISIALRALSPGINDPITAVTCIDRLTSGLAELLALADPPAQIGDAEGVLRLVVHPTTFVSVLGAAFDEIRQAAAEKVMVLTRLAESLTVLAELATEPEQRAAIAAQGIRLERLCQRSIEDPDDRADAEARLETLRRVLARA